MKGSEQFKVAIKAFLDKEAEQDEAFALSYENPSKSIDECVDYILTTVKESGCVGFDDPEIYGMAVHYYQEDDPGKIMKGISANCVVNYHIDLSESEKEEARQRALKKIEDEEIAKHREKERKEKERAKKEAEERKAKAEGRKAKEAKEGLLFFGWGEE